MLPPSAPEPGAAVEDGPRPGAASERRVDRLARLAWALRQQDPKRALRLAEAACALADRGSYDRGLAEGLLARAFCRFAEAAFAGAREDAERARERFERVGYARGVHRSLNLLGMICGDEGRLAEALGRFLALHSRCREFGDPQGASDALINAGGVCTLLSDCPNALELYLKALELAEALGDVEGVVTTLENIGLTYLEMGEFGAALGPFGRALEFRAGRPGAEHASTLMNLGRVHEGLGELDRALSLGVESLTTAERLDDPDGASYAHDLLGSVYLALGDLDRAERHLAEAIALKTRGHDPLGEVKTRLLLGRLYAGRADLGGAAEVLEQARRGAEAVGAKAELYRAHGALAAVREAQGRLGEALAHHKAFVRTKDEVFGERSDHRLQSLRVVHEVDDKEREKEIVRLRNVELVRANDELRRAKEALERQAREDPLTGLYNRRYLEPRLRAAFARARGGGALAVIICDIDNFKGINDRFSHELGDRVLVKVAELLRGGVRGADVLARYGGEEFVLLMPGLALEAAWTLCERLRRGVEAFAWPELHAELRVTVSMGVSADLTVPDHEKMIAAADVKLYEAKRAGKNRVH